MRQKELRLIITFNSTTDAMRFEKYCKQNEIEGRLIPLPRIISASCGMCFRTSPENKDRIEGDIDKAGLSVAGVYQLVI